MSPSPRMEWVEDGVGGEGRKKDALISPLRLMYVNKTIQGVWHV